MADVLRSNGDGRRTGLSSGQVRDADRNRFTPPGWLEVVQARSEAVTGAWDLWDREGVGSELVELGLFRPQPCLAATAALVSGVTCHGAGSSVTRKR